MSNLLKDLIPDAHRENAVVVAAAEAGVADALRNYIAQGMDAIIAVNLTAWRLAATSAFTREVCNWVTQQFAVALGMSIAAEAKRMRDATVREASTFASSTPDLARKDSAQRLTSGSGNTPQRDHYKHDNDHRGVLLAEVIMLRDRGRDLAMAIESKREGDDDPFTAEVAIAAGVAADIARAREQAGQSDLGRQLAGAERIAKKLLRALRGTHGSYSQILPVRRVVWADDIVLELRDKLLRIPLDVSGLNISSLYLPKLLKFMETPSRSLSYYDRDYALQAVQGVVWTDETAWPDGYREVLVGCSRPLRKGVYQVVTGV
jgi:hypothetical protein